MVGGGAAIQRACQRQDRNETRYPIVLMLRVLKGKGSQPCARCRAVNRIVYDFEFGRTPYGKHTASYPHI